MQRYLIALGEAGEGILLTSPRRADFFAVALHPLIGAAIPSLWGNSGFLVGTERQRPVETDAAVEI
jgi:hypothetical protein